MQTNLHKPRTVTAVSHNGTRWFALDDGRQGRVVIFVDGEPGLYALARAVLRAAAKPGTVVEVEEQ